MLSDSLVIPGTDEMLLSFLEGCLYSQCCLWIEAKSFLLFDRIENFDACIAATRLSS